MHICLEASNKLHYSYTEDVTFPVRVYAGTADAVLPFRAVEEWAKEAKAQNVELVKIDGGTHDGVVHTHKEVMLGQLAAEVAGAGVSRQVIPTGG